jgi:hypothetical protein
MRSLDSPPLTKFDGSPFNLYTLVIY